MSLDIKNILHEYINMAVFYLLFLGKSIKLVRMPMIFFLDGYVITIWVFVSNYAIWLVFALINTTLILYSKQFLRLV